MRVQLYLFVRAIVKSGFYFKKKKLVSLLKRLETMEAMMCGLFNIKRLLPWCFYVWCFNRTLSIHAVESLRVNPQ